MVKIVEIICAILLLPLAIILGLLLGVYDFYHQFHVSYVNKIYKEKY